MTQAELAERLGVGNDSLSRIEKGVVAPRFQRLELIAEVLGCTVSELFVCKNEEVAAKIAVIEDVLLRLPQDVRSEVLQVILNLLYSFQKLLPVCSMQAEKESQRAEQNRVMVGKPPSS